MDRSAYSIIIILATISCSNRQTIIIDERVSSRTELEKLDTADIFTYSDWPLGTAPPKYKAYETDLIVVMTWKHERQLQNGRHMFLNHFIDLAKKGEDVLIMFNGVEVSEDKLDRLKTLQPKDLKSVDTLKRIAADRILKEQAKSKNVIINTYDLKGDLIKRE